MLDDHHILVVHRWRARRCRTKDRDPLQAREHVARSMADQRGCSDTHQVGSYKLDANR